VDFTATIDVNNGVTIIMVVCSGLSILGCLTVVVSILVFRKQLLKKGSMEVLLYMFVSNLLTATGSLMGNPEDESSICWYEGIVTNVFTLSSVLWNAVLMHMLYRVILGDKQAMVVTKAMHLLCWGIPIIATLIPLSNATYGAPGGLGWCWVVPTVGTPDWAMQVWFWLSYYAWLWLTFVIIVVYLCVITYKLQSIMAKTREAFVPMFKKLFGYPIIIFISWFPVTCADFGQYSDPSLVYPDYVQQLTSTAACLMGVLSTVLFFYTNPNLLNSWSDVAQNRYNFTASENPVASNAPRRSLASRGSNQAISAPPIKVKAISDKQKVISAQVVPI
jgi:hypothetical protein